LWRNEKIPVSQKTTTQNGNYSSCRIRAFRFFQSPKGGGNEKTVVPGGREVFPASGRPPEQQEMILENETEYPILAQGH
jgi:hypothetical protein